MGFFSFTQEIAIDLGTANTVIICNDQVVVDEPSVVAISVADNKMVAVGRKAQQMIGKGDTIVRTVRPLKDGVIADFYACEMMIKGMIKMMESTDDFIGPINLGNPDERSIKKIAQLIIKLTNSSSKIVFEPLPCDDPTRRCPDITLAEKSLNWQPKIKIEEGLLNTIEYFKEEITKFGYSNFS